jgi:hypothetical protein
MSEVVAETRQKPSSMTNSQPSFTQSDIIKSHIHPPTTGSYMGNPSGSKSYGTTSAAFKSHANTSDHEMEDASDGTYPSSSPNSQAQSSALMQNIPNDEKKRAAVIKASKNIAKRYPCELFKPSSDSRCF